MDNRLLDVGPGETNNAGFDVEVRGPGSESFVSAGFVAGHGTTTEVQNYSFDLDN